MTSVESRNVTSPHYHQNAAWVVLAAGLLLTAALTLYMRSNVERAAEGDFTARCDSIEHVIQRRLEDQARILVSGAAFFNASDEVTRERWRVFNQRQDLDEQFPGIQGVGFSLLIPRSDLSRHIAGIRAEGFPEYVVKPEGDREIYSSIIYLEPFKDRNLRAFGYDMFAEPIRRFAMEQARDTNAAALSGKVLLVQEVGHEVQAGTLMYVPVYRKGLPISTLEERRAAIYGWVYSPYRMSDLMRGMFSNSHLLGDPQFHFQLFDGASISRENFLFECHPLNDKKSLSPVRFSKQIPVEFNGRRWTLQFTQIGNGLITAAYGIVWLMLLGGLSITLLLFFLIRSLQNIRFRAQRIAEKLTVDLRETAADLRTVSIYSRTLIEASLDPFVVISASGKITDVNQATEKATGVRREELIGTDFAEYFTEPDVARAGYLKVFEVGQIFDYPLSIRHRSGKVGEVLYNASVYRDEDGNVLGVFAAARDIAARKKVEEAIRVSEARYRRLVMSTTGYIYTVRVEDGRAVETTHGFGCVALNGYFPEEYKADPDLWLRMVHQEDRAKVVEMADRALKGLSVEPIEHRVYHRDGTIRWLVDTVVVKKDEMGRVISYDGLVSDITARKEAEEQLKQAKDDAEAATKAKSEFLNNIAHDFRTPIHAILGFSAFLKAEHTNERQKRFAGFINESSKNLLRLVDDLLDVSRLTSGKLELRVIGFDLEKAVLGAVEVAKVELMGKDVKVACAIGENIPRVKGDEVRFNQILSNLVSNAVKYTDQGEIIVGISAEQQDWSRHKCRIRLSVKDTGLGISKEKQAQIFDAFTRFHEFEGGKEREGVGMGLYIVKTLVDLMKGRISVVSEVGRGSEFIVVLDFDVV